MLLPLAGCTGVQSALDPAGDDARHIGVLTAVLFIGGGAIFFGVTALLLYALFRAPERRAWLGTRRTVILGGLAFPIVTLTALLPYGLYALRVTDASEGGEPLLVEVVGEQFWWRVHYPAEAGAPAFDTANEIRLPVGREVRVAMTAADVIHSFWMPNFAGKLDMIPGRVNELVFTPEKVGAYRGQCGEFCGDQHARMAFDVFALPPEDFAAWRERQAQSGAAPADPFLQRGKLLFIRNGCGNCHAVRGTEAVGRLGPDLTHVGSRATIGAGQFPNNVGTLAGWIADVQHLKTGARMPSYSSLSGEELRALAAYLENLK
ncbi:MAG TPA: cytochrome c oxidase subunit II [Mesorhizobium sp.]|jgi:cytochrome c oxidase subunit 2|nr:cytochrome c oxidase subunit II [Mesorhizobium sp.]